MSNVKTFKWLFEKYERIVIPTIQRDYLQGESELIRENLLKDIFDAFQKRCNNENKVVELNFVYGEQKPIRHITGEVGQEFIPVDGQQRLTTLFLLHLFALSHGKTDKTCNDFFQNLKKFSYEARPTSRDFFAKLVENAKEVFPCDNPEKQIKDSYWYLSVWDHDPTIKSALAMLNAINKTFKNIVDDKCKNWADDLKKFLIDEKNPLITFKFLGEEFLGKMDELYIKLNARGRMLTDFENFKAEMENVQKPLYENDETKKAKFEKIKSALDTEWLDLFWKVFNKDYDLPFLNYFSNILKFEGVLFDEEINEKIFLSSNCLDKIKENLYPKTNAKEEEKEEKNQKLLKAFEIAFVVLDFLTKCRDVSFDFNKQFLTLLPYKDSENLKNTCKRDKLITASKQGSIGSCGDKDNQLLNNLFSCNELDQFDKNFGTEPSNRQNGENNTEVITWAKIFKFKMLVDFICGLNKKDDNNPFEWNGDVDNETIFQWVRVLNNIVENSLLYSGATYKTEKNKYTELLAHKSDLLQYLSAQLYNENNTDQLNEEKLKAKIIINSRANGYDDIAKTIYRAENNKYFTRKIGISLLNGYKDELSAGNSLNFDKQWKKLALLFNAKKEDKNYWRTLIRALLCTCANKEIPSTDAQYPLSASDGRYRTLCVYDPTEAKKTKSFKSLFTDYYNIVKDTFLNRIDENNNNIYAQLNDIIKKEEKNIPLSDWRYCLLHCDELFNYMSDDHFRLMFKDDGSVYALKSLSTSSEIVNIYLKMLYHKIYKNIDEDKIEHIGETASRGEHKIELEKGYKVIFEKNCYVLKQGDKVKFSSSINDEDCLEKVVKYIEQHQLKKEFTHK